MTNGRAHDAPVPRHPAPDEARQHGENARDDADGDADTAAGVDSAPAPTSGPRRQRRSVIWPALLAIALGGAGWSLAEAATLPPLSVESLGADAIARPAAATGDPVSPISATTPSGDADAAADSRPFGPQLEVIVPPPPPPPPASSGSSRSGRKKTVTATMTYTEFCTGGASATATANSVSGLLSAVNAERARIGVAPLAWNTGLANEAAGWSAAMAANQSGNYDLNSQAGRDAVGSQAWRDAVFHHSGAGAENISFAYGSGAGPASAHSGWMGSEGHCKNVMNPSYTQFGAGDAWSSDSGYFATERFG